MDKTHEEKDVFSQISQHWRSPSLQTDWTTDPRSLDSVYWDLQTHEQEDGFIPISKRWQPPRHYMPTEDLTAAQRWLENSDIDSETKHYEAQHLLCQAASDYFVDKSVLQLVLDSKYGNPDECGYDMPTWKVRRQGRYLLSHVAKSTSTEIVEMFITCGRSNLDLRDAKGRTPLAHSAQGGRLENVKMLLESNQVDPDSRDKEGRTPLSYAASQGHSSIVRLLLEHEQVDPDSRDNKGRTPLSYASSHGDSTAVRLLLEHKKVDPDSRDSHGRTPLSYAAYLGHETILRMLLEYEQVDPDSRDVNGRTPLSWTGTARTTSWFPVTTTTQILLSMKNVDPNSKDKRGISPLHWALEYGNSAVAELIRGDERFQEQLEQHNSLDIDARCLAHWQNLCSQQHGESCEPSPIEHRLPHQFPAWVIDTHEGRLVPGDTVSRYIALSYVWPKVGTGPDANVAGRLMLKEENLQVFQERGYMQEEIVARFPPAVKDAIVLVRKYGERYLWVDCLCIVQDSKETRSQVDNMGEIYGGAYLTIIAATKDGHLSTRKHSGDLFPLSGWSNPLRGLYDKLLMSKWASRGWTFQEQILSKRAIVFLDGDVFWDCQYCVWHTNDFICHSSTGITPVRPYYDAARRMSTSIAPDLSTYMEIASLYNNRDLTYPQDALPAISGVLNTLVRSFPSGFVSGLPCMFLDIALLWQPFSKASRRVARDGGSIAPSNHIPSWAWCGWQCPVDPFELNNKFDYFDSLRNEANIATVQTYSLFQWYALSEDLQHQLPLGTATNFALSEGEVMLPDIQNSPQQCVPAPPRMYKAKQPISQQYKDWPFLSAKTTVASLYIEDVFRWGNYPDNGPSGPMARTMHEKIPISELSQFTERPVSNDVCHLITLQDKQGSPGGVLRRMNDDRAEPGDVIELVALSTGSVQSKDAWARNEMMRSGTRKTSEYHELKKELETYGVDGEQCLEYHFYNVMWIEREGDIAYRRAVGRVPKVVWEANCTGPTKIILG